MFYFIWFHFIFNYLNYADSIVGMAGYISQSNKQESQITCHSNSNSKVVETAENCCWVNTGNADVAEKRSADR
jgi:hypothetical protein